jgi:glycine cleavage system transcriptional repressor
VPRHFALSGVGRDRPGIVARVSAVLVRHGVNVEDSQMTILRGHFSMVLIVSAPEEVDVEELREELSEAGRELNLEAIALSGVEELDTTGDPLPSHMVTVYGADHPGILAAVSAAMAARQVDITDLTTRIIGESGAPVYALMMEVALPEGVEVAEIEEALQAVGREQGVDVSVRALETEAL